MEDRKTGTSGLLKDWAGMIAHTANVSFFKAIIARANGDFSRQPGDPRPRVEEEQDYSDSPPLPIGPETPVYVPLDHMFGHAPAIRTLAQDRGSFTTPLDRYEAVPYALAEDIIAARKKAASKDA